MLPLYTLYLKLCNLWAPRKPNPLCLNNYIFGLRFYLIRSKCLLIVSILFQVNVLYNSLEVININTIININTNIDYDENFT